MVTAPRAALAVDIGGTRLRVACVTADGRVVERWHAPTPAAGGPGAVLTAVATAARAVMRAVAPRACVVVGVSAPGPLDPASGVVYETPNLPGWRDVPLRAWLERDLELPVWVHNDANLAALGEHRHGAGRGCDPLVYLTVSTGIGGGVILGGRMLEGRHGLAAELGHIIVRAGGPACNLGHRGCLEALASGTAVARRAAERIAAGDATSIPAHVAPDGRLDARAVAAAAAAGDALARTILREAGEALGLGIGSLVNAFDPARVVVGGGLTRSWALLRPAVEAALATVVLAPEHRRSDVVIAALGDDAGLVGAAAHALAHVA